MNKLKSKEWDYIRGELKKAPMFEYKGFRFYSEDIEKIDFILKSSEIETNAPVVKYVQRNSYKSEENKLKFNRVITDVMNGESLNKSLKKHKLSKTTYYRIKDLNKNKKRSFESKEDFDLII